MLKTGSYLRGLVVLVVLFLGGCGYYFPHVYDGPDKIVAAPSWKNRTNKLGMDMKIYQSLSQWFQKSSSVHLTREQSGADYTLTGEILSISLPSVSWNTASITTGTKVSITVRYLLKDAKTGKILWDVPSKLYTADYMSSTPTSAADDEALAKITNDMSEHIYLGVLDKLRKQRLQNKAAL